MLNKKRLYEAMCSSIAFVILGVLYGTQLAKYTEMFSRILCKLNTRYVAQATSLLENLLRRHLLLLFIAVCIVLVGTVGFDVKIHKYKNSVHGPQDIVKSGAEVCLRKSNDIFYNGFSFGPIRIRFLKGPVGLMVFLYTAYTASKNPVSWTCFCLAFLQEFAFAMLAAGLNWTKEKTVLEEGKEYLLARIWNWKNRRSLYLAERIEYIEGFVIVTKTKIGEKNGNKRKTVPVKPQYCRRHC